MRPAGGGGPDPGDARATPPLIAFSMTHPTTAELALLAVSWAAYFALHSTLASLAVKGWVARRCPACMPGYRIAFNTQAVLLLIPVIGLMWHLRGPLIWTWDGAWSPVAHGLAALAVLGFVLSLRHYDGQEFLGLRQWRARERSVMDQEAFHLSPLHRLVRHPWYTLGLVLIWTRDLDAARLLSAVMASAYFVVGSWLEERRLLRYHGDAYAEYRRLVPALLPLPWRVLSAERARDLLRRARRPGA